MGDPARDPEAAWRCYARHAASIVAGGPAPTVRYAPSAFAACSGAPYVDINQVALYGDAHPDDVRAVLADVTGPDLPAVLARSTRTSEAAVVPVQEAGFLPLAERELLFSMDGDGELRPSRFSVRPIATEADIDALIPIASEVHGYEPALTARLLGAPARAGGDLGGWLAWDGETAVSCAFVTTVGATLGLWSVMTAAAHRGRGAGGAVVRGALCGAADRAGGRIERTVFWASPSGGPFYRSLGFQPVDEFEVWVREVAQPAA